MRQNPWAFAVTAAALAVLGGCVTGNSGTPGSFTTGNPTANSATDNATAGTPAQQKALARYLAYAGPPIPYFAWVGRLFSWEPLSMDQLVVQVTPGNDYYLLKVWPPCDLRMVITGVGISSLSSTVYAHGDSVTLHTGSSSGLERCPIDEIRRIDYKGMKADLKAQSAAAKVAQ